MIWLLLEAPRPMALVFPELFRLRRRLRDLIAVAAMAVLLAAPPPAIAAGVPTPTNSESLPDLVARLMPSVVNITTKRLVPAPTNTLNASGSSDGGDGSTSNITFGSGFVVDSEGMIVTNNHVIDGAYDVTATFQDGTIAHAEVVATTKIGDLALLKVNLGRKLPPVLFGDSTALRVGEPVLAIGNPLGFGGTVSTGIVSAVNRDIMLSPFDDFIQTDASLNHGNSGGPLFNMAGEVIGLNTALYSPAADGGSIGLGFAIPAYAVQFVVGQLRSYGHVRAGELGLQLQDVTLEIATAAGLPPIALSTNAPTGHPDSGVIVTSVETGGPADKAGIHDGDIITRVDGFPLQDMRTFARILAVRPLDKPVPITAWREGKSFTVNPIVREWFTGEEVDQAALARSRIQRAAAMDLGLRLAPLTDQARTARDLAPGQPGVLVTSVMAGSVAGDRGLGAGDVIIKVQGVSVNAPDQVLSYLRGMIEEKRPMVLLLVRNKAGLRWVPLPISVPAVAGKS